MPVINPPAVVFSKESLPLIALAGDSTIAYNHTLTGNASSLVDNGNGTATIEFSADQGFAVGDPIGIQNCSHDEYEIVSTPVLAKTGAGPYFYTYALNKTPTVSPDGGASIAARYPLRASTAGFATWARNLCGRRVRFVNTGQAGNTMAKTLAAFEVDVAPLRPDRVSLTIGINDVFGSGMTLAQITPDIVTYLAKCKSIGAKLDITTPFPQINTRTSWTTGKRDIFIALRKWMMQFAADNGLHCVDWASCTAGTVQVQDPTNANADPATSMGNADKVHPWPLACYAAGKAWAAIYNDIYPSSGAWQVARNVTDGGLFANPTMTGSGGASTNGTGTVAAGPVATGMTVTVTSGARTATPYQTARTVASDGDIGGNWQGVSFVAGAAGDQFTFTFPAMHTLVTNGNIVRAQGLLRILTGPEFVREALFFVNSQTATTSNLLVTDGSLSTAQMGPLAEAFTELKGADVPVRTPVGTHGAPTAFLPTIRITAAAAGTIAAEIACWSFEIL